MCCGEIPCAELPLPKSQLYIAVEESEEKSALALKNISWSTSTDKILPFKDGVDVIVGFVISWQGSKQEISADHPLVPAELLLKNSMVMQPDAFVAEMKPGLWVAFPE